MFRSVTRLISVSKCSLARFSSATKRGGVAMTGSSGIMGSRLYPALVEDGWEVVGISRGKGHSQGGPGRDGKAEVHSEFVNKTCDFADPASMESGIFEGC